MLRAGIQRFLPPPPPLSAVPSVSAARPSSDSTDIGDAPHAAQIDGRYAGVGSLKTEAETRLRGLAVHLSIYLRVRASRAPISTYIHTYAHTLQPLVPRCLPTEEAQRRIMARDRGAIARALQGGSVAFHLPARRHGGDGDGDGDGGGDRSGDGDGAVMLDGRCDTQ